MTVENRRVHVTAELARGHSALQAARELFRLGLYHDAVSRAYYAALHFTLAALLTEGVEPRTRSGVSAMFGLHFIVSGRLPPERAKELSRLEQFRTEADYNRFFVFTADSALEEIQIAEQYCSELGAWLRAGGWINEASK